MKLTLVPYCGLANRLNMIENALLLKQERPDYDMHFYWGKDNDCNAWFDDLFLPIDGIEVSRLSDLSLKPRGNHSLWLPELLRKFKFDASLKCRKIQHTDELLHPNPKWRNVYVCGYNHLCTLRADTVLSHLYRPVPELEERISQMTAHYGQHVVGVHVRRTDHVRAISHSPMQNYLKRMERYVSDDDDCQFFVASDDETVKQQLRDTFGDRVITMPAVLDRNSLQGMKDAVVELFALGRCNRILGSIYSTYCVLAANLYRIPTEDVEKGTDFSVTSIEL